MSKVLEYLIVIGLVVTAAITAWSEKYYRMAY